MIRFYEGVRYTHLPTGVTAISRNCAPRGQKWRFYDGAARKLLLARLSRPAGMAPIRRTYDLCPPLGIDPNIRQDGKWLVTGKDAVESILRGAINPLLGDQA